MRSGLHMLLLLALPLVSHGACSSTQKARRPKATSPAPAPDAREVRLRNLVQLTRDRGSNAEASWASSGTELIVQSKRPPFSCDQIYRLPVDGSKATLVATGLGRSAYASFLPGDSEIVYTSTHQSNTECPPVPDQAQGEIWPIDDDNDMYLASADGSNLRRLGSSPRYDAEAAVCAGDGSIVFTSTRNGDLDLYRMDRDGGNLVQLTFTPGYDGGASFSPDCTEIVWAAGRPTGEALRAYRELLDEGLVRPGELEVFVAKSDGSEVRQLTYMDAVSFAPAFHPGGKRVIFASNAQGTGDREFDIWAVNTDGSRLERITYAPGFDGFPSFSPDGAQLAFSSSRNQARAGETDVFIADFRDDPEGATQATGADSFLADVAWLADDAREGRGVGTAGLEAAAIWLAARFESLGLQAGYGDSYFQSLDVAVAIGACSDCSLRIGRDNVDGADFVPLGFSASGSVRAQTIAVGFGIVARELGVDDYRGKSVKGKVAVMHRYTPNTGLFKVKNNYDAYSDLHRKASTAREQGAIAVIVVDGSPPGVEDGEEAALPELELDRLGAVGIPVLLVRAGAGAALLTAQRTVAVEVQLELVARPSKNVVGILRAGAGKREGSIVIGAHYDHLGGAAESSQEAGSRAVHNGADDNASGVAALLDVAASLAADRATLERDIVFVAFTGEENGLAGSDFFVDNLPEDVRPVAMLNMDMVGRLRENRVRVMGATTASEWPALAEAACAAGRLRCTVGGDGYGPSSHSSFTAAGVPVLSFSTGAHADHHTPSDATGAINAIGGKRIADVVAEIARQAANLASGPSFQPSAMPGTGDRGFFGASLGTIPDYSGDASQTGMLLAEVRPGGAAELAGIRGGDRILAIGDTALRSVKDLVDVLQAARPGETTVVKLERAGQILMLKIEYQTSAR